jgi:molybdopterin-guanine dinucleotide biosynthesis protein A
VKQALEEDLWKLSAWHHQACLLILTPEQTKEISGSEYTFWNLNTPEDFQQAELAARQFNLLDDLT